jgi:hypothetical protein
MKDEKLSEPRCLAIAEVYVRTARTLLRNTAELSRESAFNLTGLAQNLSTTPRTSLRAAAELLVDFHEEFAPLFGMRQAQDHAFDYINGLMTCPGRKSVEPIALLVGHGDASGLQKFLNSAPWDRDDVQDDIQAVFARRPAPSADGTAVAALAGGPAAPAPRTPRPAARTAARGKAPRRGRP